jgi:dihydrofolate reductase
LGGFLNGRVTYELMARFWPTADTNPSRTGPMVEFARIWRDMPKIVFSRTLERADWNATVVRDVAAEEIQVIGQGKPLFQRSEAKTNLRLAETRTFGNGVVLLRYSVLTHKTGK